MRCAIDIQPERKRERKGNQQTKAFEFTPAQHTINGMVLKSIE